MKHSHGGRMRCAGPTELPVCKFAECGRRLPAGKCLRKVESQISPMFRESIK